MEINEWLTEINKLDKTFFVPLDQQGKKSKHYLLSFINTVTSKLLTLQKYDKYFSGVAKNFNNDMILIWDCEFQVFKSNVKNKKIEYETTIGQQMIRCISEIGLLLFLKINNNIYLAGIFHIGFLNKIFTNIKYFIPFYHEYMSTNNYSTNKIINIENNIYPHIKFENIWNEFKFNNNGKNFQKNIISLLNDKILQKNKFILEKFKSQLNDLISLIDNNRDTDKLISKIMVNLKNIIYNNTINKLNKVKEFTKIRNIYLNDSYVKSILIDNNNHNIVIDNLNMIFANGLNIVKGYEDIKAICNHNLLLNNKIYKIKNVIDIAEYNDNIYKLCNSAKLYESYLCLSKSFGDVNSNLLIILKKWMETNFKPHNPLVDAFYTLQVYILYNKNM
jgi:hypothetical protein